MSAGSLGWIFAAIGLAALAPPLPWTTGAAAAAGALLAAGLGAGRWARLGALALALGLSPILAASAARGGALAAALAGLALAAGARAGAGLPAPVLGVVAAGLGLEAARLVAVGDRGLALSLALGGLGALAAGAAPRGRAPVAAGLALALSQLGPAAALLLRPVATPEQARQLAARDLWAHELDALTAQPALGLAALEAAPRAHALALALAPRVGLDATLQAGWYPDMAPLPPGLRLALARRLDEAGEGGRALRLLRRGRADPEVAWAWGLAARRLGRDEPAIAALPAPAQAPALPGEIPLGWVFLTDGRSHLDVHVVAPLTALSWDVEVSTWQGAPELVFEVDDREQLAIRPQGGRSTLQLPVDLQPGPHRLMITLRDDLSGPGGDRNAVIWSVRGEPGR